MKDYKRDYNPDHYRFPRHDPFRYGYWDDKVNKRANRELLWNVVGTVVLCIAIVLLLYV